MDPTVIVLLSLGLGIVIGGGFCFAIVMAKRRGAQRAERMRPSIPDSALDVLDQLPEAAILLDSSLSAVYANPTARDEHTHLEESLLSSPDFLKEMRDVMRHGAPYLRMPESATESTRLRAFRVKKRFVAVLIDDVGEEQRVNNMRRDFIANVSHELKTPISAISLLAEAIEQAAEDTETVQQFSQTLLKEARRLGELSHDIIHLSEAQSEIVPTERESVSLREMVRRQVEDHQAFARGQHVSVVLTEPKEEQRSAQLLGRASSLNIAVANLLSNAIRHSPEGGRVGVGMRFVETGLDVAITDQGPGIAPELQPRVFERFFRVDGSRTRDSGGTGLGLSIVKHTMRSHGGDVTLWSQPGVGSTFTLHFPLHDELTEDKPRKRAKRKKHESTNSAR
ncbi:MAG: sensor histidine kinase [Canibacter sp.]